MYRGLREKLETTGKLNLVAVRSNASDDNHESQKPNAATAEEVFRGLVQQPSFTPAGNSQS